MLVFSLLYSKKLEFFIFSFYYNDNSQKTIKLELITVIKKKIKFKMIVLKQFSLKIMNFEIPSEANIVKGLCSLDCTIFNIEDVAMFLSENIPEKKSADRFISWLVILRILTQKRQSWGTELYLMTDNYFKRCKNNFSKKQNDPLLTLSKNIQYMIKPDIENGMQWFDLVLKEIRLTNYVQSPLFRLYRIYAMIACENDRFLYQPNLFYIGCICLAMTSIFSRNAKLPMDFAEAISFYLTNSILLNIPLLHVPENCEQYVDHFNEINELIGIKAPEQRKALKQNRASSVYFAVRYEQLLFACENHQIKDLLNIWDQIFIHLNRNEFISCLTISHIIQVQLPPGPQNVISIISNWKNWDTTKIIKDALEMLEHKRSIKDKCFLFLCPSFNLSGYDVSNLHLQFH